MRVALRLAVGLLVLVACSNDESQVAETSRDEEGTGDDGTPGGAVGAGELPGAIDDLGEESGVVTYTIEDEGLFRIEARKGAEPENLSEALDDVAPGGGDEWVNISPDGDWLLVSSERFEGCEGWACVAVVDTGISEVVPVEIDGEPLHANAFSALGPGGTVIVYESEEGSHESDLWSIARRDDGWTTPTLLTADSEHDFNSAPSLSADGETVVFDCGATPYSEPGTSICRVSADGADLTTLVSPTDGPGGSEENALHGAAVEDDGAVVFEADWLGGESLWRVGSEGPDPTLISDAFANDNSPCVLANGRIASLWLERPDSDGVHELKVMDPEGEGYLMVVIDVDVADIGLGCAA